MSELKAIQGVINGQQFDLYFKSEADKVIEDLKESHKKEVEQLLMEVVKLKELSVQCQRAAQTLRKKMNHHKYKRCLAMAEMCDAKYDEEDAKVNGRGASWDYTSEEMKYWQRWRNRWLVLADKFKPNN